jgi:starch-binding outer membrane protein, SusD/RagB family
MKSFRYILPVLLLIHLASCKKFLQVQPRDSASDLETIFDKTSAETAVRGIYRSLADNSYYGSTFQSNGYLQGDNLDWTDSRTVSLQFIQHDVRADNEEVASAWSAIYRTINRANYVIAKVPEVEDALFTQTLRNQLIGEAHFVRALAYFDLARTWGGVQIVLTPTLSATDKNNIKRSTLDQTWAQVLSDLEAAEPLLPETTNRIRGTKKTVWALRARYHLYRQEWEQAETYAGKLIGDAGNYKLAKPYNAFFANNAVATPESVFELSYSATNTNGHRNQWQPPANGGTRRWAPNVAFLALVNDPAVGGNRNALVDKTTQGQWYGNLYYRSPATDPAYVIRIAELFLIRAEARAQQNKTIEAAADINAIRDRAGLTATTAVAKEELLLAIENERRIEFAFEPHRWYDLVRTGRAAAVTGVTDVNKYVLPIPIGELNADKALEQNTGY